MSHCHDHDFAGVSRTYKTILWIVIFLNLGMFAVEISAGYTAQSQALKADALDFFADGITYFISLVVIGMSLKTRAMAALLKAFSLFGMGLWVAGTTLYHLFFLGLPDAQTMGIIGLMALVANLISVALLVKFKDGDANVRSVWLCSRNDAIGNVAVMISAGLVAYLGNGWPDVIVAGLMAVLFLTSATKITQQALREYRGGDDSAEDAHVH